MKQAVLAHASTTLPIIGLLLFFILFLGLVTHLFFFRSKQVDRSIAQLPLKDGGARDSR